MNVRSEIAERQRKISRLGLELRRGVFGREKKEEKEPTLQQYVPEF